jgi:hypothetical protein
MEMVAALPASGAAAMGSTFSFRANIQTSRTVNATSAPAQWSTEPVLPGLAAEARLDLDRTARRQLTQAGNLVAQGGIPRSLQLPFLGKNEHQHERRERTARCVIVFVFVFVFVLVVGLLFVIPGVTETFRVNGRATLTTDSALLAPSAVEGKLPKLGILIDIEAAYTHCSKAFLRSELWNPERYVERTELPSNGEFVHAIQDDRVDAAQYDAERAARYARREGFY